MRIAWKEYFSEWHRICGKRHSFVCLQERRETSCGHTFMFSGRWWIIDYPFLLFLMQSLILSDAITNSLNALLLHRSSSWLSQPRILRNPGDCLLWDAIYNPNEKLNGKRRKCTLKAYLLTFFLHLYSTLYWLIQVTYSPSKCHTQGVQPKGLCKRRQNLLVIGDSSALNFFLNFYCVFKQY